jgi:hypothetical protein
LDFINFAKHTEGAKPSVHGLNVMPPILPGGPVDFIEWLVPKVRRAALLRTDHEGPALRVDFDLRPPAGCFAGHAASAE